jgi:inner membrane protein
MDTVTHALIGVTAAGLGLGSLEPKATILLVISTTLPDIDYISGFKNPACSLKYHRGITHSIWGGIALAGIITGFWYLIVPGSKFFSLLLLALFGVGLHILLDLTNTYGVRLFAGLKPTYYSFNLLPVTDPWFLSILLIGAVIRIEFPSYVKVISYVIFFLCGLYILLRIYLKQKIKKGVLENLVSDIDKKDLEVYPLSQTPFTWLLVLRQIKNIYTGEIDGLKLEIKGLRCYPTNSLACFQVSEAKKTYTAKVFFNFAKFLYQEIIPKQDGLTLIRWRDLRWDFSNSKREMFWAEVSVHSSGKIIRENLSQ